MSVATVSSTPARFLVAPLLVVGLGLVTCLPAAHAQDSSESASDEQKASDHFSKGAELFLKKEYERAIIEFQRAYQYQPNPMILYNQAVPHARIGNFEKAISVAERAAEGGLPDKPATKNRARIAAWSAALSARRNSTTVADMRASTAPEPDPPPTDTGGGKNLTGIGWTGAALGVIGLGGVGYGVYVDRALSDDIQAYRQAAQQGDGDAFRARRQTIQSRQTRGRIALYAGISTAVVGGLIWTVDILNGPPDTGPSMSASRSDDGGAVGFTLHF